MEYKLFDKPSPSSENRFDTTATTNFSTVRNRPQNPFITNIDTFDHGIESVFSRLALSPNFQPYSGGSSSFSRHDVVASVPSPYTFAQNQQSSLWAPAQSSNVTANGPLDFPRAHQRINVDPEAIGFSWRSPYLRSDDHARLMNTHQRQDSYASLSDDFDCCFLHGKEPFSRTNFTDFPFFGNHQQEVENMSSILNLRLEGGMSEEEIEMILPQVMEYSIDLMMNQFGSHFVPSFFSSCNEDQRTRVIASLTRYPYKFITLCLNSYGSRTVQKMVEKLITPKQISLVVSALRHDVLALSSDPNGVQVVDYCVRNFSCEYVEHLLNEIANNCFKIGTDKWGCCFLQSCLRHSRGEAKQRLISEIIVNVIHLSDDPYGNYVVQCVLGMKMPRVTEDLLRRVQGHFVSFAFNKYASNVVEKFLLLSEEHVSASIILEILGSPYASMLLLDPFGNFVIQSALMVSKGGIREALLHLIRLNALSMQCNLYGMKILRCLKKV